MERSASSLYRMSMWSLCAALLLLAFSSSLAPAQTTVRFAAFGDFGSDNTNEQNVANLVASLNPDIIITTGDNNYPSGAATTIDNNVGKYFHNFIGAYTGSYTPGAATNKFFPSLGNHDLDDGALGTPYYNYFTLPGAGITSSNTSGNERYYDFVVGPVHFFAIDSDPREPDGTTSGSVQGQWLQARLAAATERWKVVYFHEPPYTSCSTHPANTDMRWPFEAWGASAVLDGHNHVYERIVRDDNSDGVLMPYITTGAGGQSLYGWNTPVEGSEYRYSSNYGSVVAEASPTTLKFVFYSITGGGTALDSMTLTAPADPEYLETFDSFTVGQPVSQNSGWYDDGTGPTVGASNGVAGSHGLNAAQYNCTWLDHEFNWNDATLQKIVLGMDFQTSPAGLFDDDRVAWTILSNSTSSDAHFGVQLDNTSSGHGIETYWDNISGASSNIRLQIASLPTLGNSTWYRLRAEITKLTAGSASIAVRLIQLNASGDSIALTASGTLANTAALSSSEQPDPKYFTATSMWPAYKNYNATEGNADNAYFSIVGGGGGDVYSLTVNVSGSGTVNLSPLKALYSPGEVVQLTAVPSGGYTFSGWSGDLAGSANPTNITMNGDRSVTATFTSIPPGDIATIVPFGAIWKYRDWGTDLGTAWQATGFNDAGWPSGPARLGFGDTQATTVNGGPEGNVNTTIYFRTSFGVSDPSVYSSLGVDLIRDDGAVIYLNGTEVWRSNMPAGTITYSTFASSAVEGANETAIFSSPSFGTSALIAGTNVLAVEVHQINSSSSDLGFDMRLFGTTASTGPKTLTLNVIGQGSISKVPDQAQYDAGTVVQLTAIPDAGWQFAGWSGDLIGTTNPVNVTMGVNKSITATFVNPSASLVGYWKFDETSGTIANDASGNGNNGTITGGTWGTGKVAGALTLNGTTGAVSIAPSSSLTFTNQMTFACWMNADALTADGVALFSRATGAGDSYWVDFVLHARRVAYMPVAYQCAFYIDLNGDSQIQAIEDLAGGMILQPQTWYHIAATYDGTTMRFYIDGTQTASTPYPGGTIPNRGRAIWLGADETWGEHYQGRLDDVRLYNRALSQTEIQALMAGTTLTQYTLTVNVTGDGAVTRNPSLAQYDSGSVVQLTAVPAYGNVFSAWSGDLTGTTNPQSITMLGNRTVTAAFEAGAPGAPLTFTALGDFGINNTNEANVASLIASLNPDIMVTMGDNNYPSGAASTMDANVGQYFHNLIGAYAGSYGAGAPINRFFPSLGNHDWDPANAQPYLNYFTLPGAGYTNTSGNERYYDFVVGPVHFFALDSDPNEPDGRTSSSVQGQWLQARLAAATEPWKVVYFHQPPYSSGTTHGPTPEMAWPFEAWGVDAVLGGHEHHYERIVRDVNGDGISIPYIVCGTGGNNLYSFGTPTAGSVVRYNANYGTVYALATDTTLTFRFYSITGGGTLIDTMQLVKLNGKFALAINVIGSGTVTKNPNLIGYDPGSNVQLTANASPGYEFTGWSGALTGSANPANLTMDANKSVTATFTSIAGDTTVLLAFGSTWKYLDNNVDQGTAWRAPAFNDATWASGPARLGFGDTQATVVNGGPTDNRYPTIYFRTSFTVADPTKFAALGIGLIRDDGAVIYLNGTEVWRDNMPAGTITHTTWASTAVGGTDETAVFSSPAFGTSALVAGTNVLAVEIHQVNATSSDLGFDMRLYGIKASVQPETFVAYNDMNGIVGDANAAFVTRHTYAATAGALKDSATGTNLTVTVTGATVGGYDPQTASGDQAAIGTDAGLLFGPPGAAIVDLNRTIELDDPAWQNILTFNNLDPAKRYSIALTANRANPTYAGARYTRVTISGAAAFTNASSAGVVVNSTSSVSFCIGDNTAAGYVAKWIDVDPGPDGTFSVMSEWDNTLGSGDQNIKGYAMTAFRLATEGEAAASETKAVTQANTNVDFPVSGAVVNLGVLPAGGGSITITRHLGMPAGPPTFPDPPADANYVPLWVEITSTMAPNSFVALITLDVSGIAGFGPTSHLICHTTGATSWIPMPGTYNAGNHTFTFTASHFSDFGFANPVGSAYELYVDTAPGDTNANVIYPNTGWGAPTSYEPDDWSWTGSQLVTVYLDPQPGSVFGVCNLTAEWDSTVMHLNSVNWGSAGSPNGLFGSGHAYPVAAMYDQLGRESRVTLNCSRLDNNNFTTVAGDHIAALVFTLLKPGYTPVSIAASDIRAYDTSNPPENIFITPHVGHVKAYLGDIAGSAGESAGDGKINFDDLVYWSYSYWSGTPGYAPGMTYYKTKYDMGPTQNGLTTSLPVVDGMINFEDLVMFSLAYGDYSGFHLPKVAAPANEGMTITAGTPSVSNGETRIPVLISGDVQDVRAVSMTASGKFGKFIGAEKGALLQGYTTPVPVMANASYGRVDVDLAVMGLGAKAIAENGELVVLRFAGTASVQISRAEARSSANSVLGLTVKGPEKEIPTVFALDQNYPNPFNPTTTIQFELPSQANVEVRVYNLLGEEVVTLVNEVREAGVHTVVWNGMNNAGVQVTSGIYFYRMKAGSFTAIKKMVLLR
jgi:tartrate-resistant acid phosphatase type 5